MRVRVEGSCLSSDLCHIVRSNQKESFPLGILSILPHSGVTPSYHSAQPPSSLLPSTCLLPTRTPHQHHCPLPYPPLDNLPPSTLPFPCQLVYFSPHPTYRRFESLSPIDWLELRSNPFLPQTSQVSLPLDTRLLNLPAPSHAFHLRHLFLLDPLPLPSLLTTTPQCLSTRLTPAPPKTAFAR